MEWPIRPMHILHDSFDGVWVVEMLLHLQVLRPQCTRDCCIALHHPPLASSDIVWVVELPRHLKVLRSVPAIA